MASARDIRRLAFQALFQLDAHLPHSAPGGAQKAGSTLAPGEQEAVRASLDDTDGYTAKERDTAFELALAAFTARGQADAAMQELAPTWPAHRQAAVDRAILRLAHFEMTSGRTPPKVAVNEAVELSKVFSTDKSPAFVNGLLDKILKRIERAPEPPAPTA